MLYDVRTYRVAPGKIKQHLDLYAAKGREAQMRNLGEPALYLVTETGPVNTYVHIWQYENAGDRESKRANMAADPDWQGYLKASADLGALIQQDNQLMVPAPFFTPKK